MNPYDKQRKQSFYSGFRQITSLFVYYITVFKIGYLPLKKIFTNRVKYIPTTNKHSITPYKTVQKWYEQISYKKTVVY